MQTPYPVGAATGQSVNSDAKYYCCAALTAPSTITGHMQTGDILVSINEESLISDNDQSAKNGGPEAFFDKITLAIKHAKCPRIVRVLRPSATPVNAVYDVELNVAEASFLFSENHRALSSQVPKFTVGKLALAKANTAIMGNFFDVVFPTQTSLGIRIFPFKLVDSNARAAASTRSPSKYDGRGSVMSRSQVAEDDEERYTSESSINCAQRYSDSSSACGEQSSGGWRGSSNTGRLPSETEALTNITNFLTRLDYEKASREGSPDELDDVITQRCDQGSRRFSSESTPKRRHGGQSSAERLLALSPPDDDVVSDFGRISVGARVSRLELNMDDFIPVSSPAHDKKMRVREENMYEELQREEREARMVGTLAVEGMVARYELNEKKCTPPRTSLGRRGSPIKRLAVQSSLENPTSSVSPKSIRNLRQSLPCRMTPYRNAYSNPQPPTLSPSTPSPTRRRRKPFESINPDDMALYGAVPNTVEKIQLDVQKLLKENQKLKAKMGFMQCSVSIEKQLLNYELKGVKAKLQLSEKELEESKIESKMNDIIMQDHLDNSIKDIVGVILSEKEDLAQKLHDARNEIATMEMRYNDRLESVQNEKENIKSELDMRKDDCIMLTADVLNLQAQRDCMKSSTVMTDYRTRSASKTQAKELTKIREAERRAKEQLIDFIVDFDKTADPSGSIDDVIESFLSGRGLAINRNRRKHFAALKADNNRLYDDLDTMQELLEVEAALQFTRVELYTKSVIHRASDNSADTTPTKSSVKMLLNATSPFRENGKKINGRWSLEVPKEKKMDISNGRASFGGDRSDTASETFFNHIGIGATGGIKLTDNPLRMKIKQPREKVPRLKLRQSNGESEYTDCKENESALESATGITSNFNSSDNSHYGCDENDLSVMECRIMDKGNRVKSADYRRSPLKPLSSTCAEASNATVSPFISITPRRKIELPTLDGSVLPARAPTGYSPDTPTSADLSTCVGVNGISSVFKGTRRPFSERCNSPVKRPLSVCPPSIIMPKPVITGELSEIYPNIE